jgi:hypothetical protein
MTIHTLSARVVKGFNGLIFHFGRWDMPGGIQAGASYAGC